MKRLFTLLLILVSFQAFCVKVTFKVDMTDQDTTQGVWVTGHMAEASPGGDWNIKRMVHEGNMIFSWDTTRNPGDSIAYYFLTTGSWDNYLDYREEVPEECDFSAEINGWEGDRAIVVPAKDTIVRNVWGSCETWLPTSVKAYESGNARIKLYPNPSEGDVTIIVPESQDLLSINVIDISGKLLDVDKSFVSATEVRLETDDLPEGIYFIKVYNNEFSGIRKLIIK
jgi:arabinogalactan endo-1,4-beta-galactosidase